MLKFYQRPCSETLLFRNLLDSTQPHAEDLFLSLHTCCNCQFYAAAFAEKLKMLSTPINLSLLFQISMVTLQLFSLPIDLVTAVLKT